MIPRVYVYTPLPRRGGGRRVRLAVGGISKRSPRMKARSPRREMLIKSSLVRHDDRIK